MIRNQKTSARRSLIRLSVSDGQKPDSSKDVSFYRYIIRVGFLPTLQLIALFRIWPSSESRLNVIAKYTSAVIFKNIFWFYLLYNYLSVCVWKQISISYLLGENNYNFPPITHFMKVYFHTCQYLFTAYFRKILSFEMHFFSNFWFQHVFQHLLKYTQKKNGPSILFLVPW